MKRFLGIGALSLLLSCNVQPPTCERIISVEPYHSTRIAVTYEDVNGRQRTKSMHYTQQMRCNEVTLHPKDYMPQHGGAMPYGQFHADMYAAYKRK